jgi:two-component system, chemotaxis family, sensor kinase Cph1
VRCRDVFVLEDEALIAMEIETMLRSAGYRVIGPASSIAEAMQICDALTDGCALLDVNLDGAAVTPVACLLAERGIPFALVTGYDAASVPEQFRDRIIIRKPFTETDLYTALDRLAA